MVEASRSGQSQPTPIESSDPITRLAIRDLEARSKTTGELAAAFQTTIEKPGTFSWIGVYKHLDPDFGITVVEVYLAEKKDRAAATGEQVVNAVDAFDDLALSLRPVLDARLHLVAEDAIPELRQRLEGGQSDQTHQLVFEEQIPQAA